MAFCLGLFGCLGLAGSELFLSGLVGLGGIVFREHSKFESWCQIWNTKLVQDGGLFCDGLGIVEDVWVAQGGK